MSRGPAPRDLSPYPTTLYEKNPTKCIHALASYYLVGLEAGLRKGLTPKPAFLYTDERDLCITLNFSGTDMSTGMTRVPTSNHL